VKCRVACLARTAGTLSGPLSRLIKHLNENLALPIRITAYHITILILICAVLAVAVLYVFFWANRTLQRA
jgi:hypothetical protein